MGYSGAWVKMIHEKKWREKPRGTVPLNHLEGCMLKSVELLRHSQHLHSHVYKCTYVKQCWGCDILVRIWIRIPGSVPLNPALDPTPDPTPFFSDFKDAKTLFFFFIFFFLPACKLSEVLKLNFVLRFCMKILFCKHYFSSLNTCMRKADTESLIFTAVTTIAFLFKYFFLCVKIATCLNFWTIFQNL